MTENINQKPATAASKLTDDAAKMAEQAGKRFEQNTERMKEFNASMVESAKSGSRTVIENYEQAAKSFFAMQRQAVDGVQNEWVKNASDTQIQFAEEVTDAWVKAARKLLK